MYSIKEIEEEKWAELTKENNDEELAELSQ